MNELTTFTHARFGALRTVEVEGRILFCGKDAATALGYENASKAIRDHCRQDGGPKRYPILDRMGRVQEATFITEGDLYRLIASSKLPSAVEFEAWVFDEMVPSVRKYGGYLTPEAAERALADPDFIIRLATELKAERAARAEVEAQAAAQSAELEAARPKALFADAVACSDTEILVGELAKILKGNGVHQAGGTRLFKWLRRKGYLIKRPGADWNMPTQRSMELGLFRIKETAVTHSDGHVSISKTPKVTGKGQAYFVEGFLSGRFSAEELTMGAAA